MCDGNGFFDMRRLDHAGLTGINPTGLVTFVESHDTQDNPPARIVNNKHLAYAYILTSEGYPVVFYRDYFDFGLKSVINNLIWIHEKIAAGETRERIKALDVFAYERLGGSHLLAAINDTRPAIAPFPLRPGSARMFSSTTTPATAAICSRTPMATSISASRRTVSSPTPARGSTADSTCRSLQ
jgi:alpha-amylase